MTWPDAPLDTIMTIGLGGNCSVIIPSLRLVVVSARGDWGNLAAGDSEAPMNQHLARLVRSVQSSPEP